MWSEDFTTLLISRLTLLREAHYTPPVADCDQSQNNICKLKVSNLSNSNPQPLLNCHDLVTQPNLKPTISVPVDSSWRQEILYELDVLVIELIFLVYYLYSFYIHHNMANP